MSSTYKNKPSLKKFINYAFYFNFLTFCPLLFFIPPVYSATIGINQIVSHPALDKTCQGILDELKEFPPKTEQPLKILRENAQGQLIIASQIAQKFKGKKVDIIVALGTTAAQASLRATKEKEILVVFSSVTDPLEAGLLKKLDRPEGRITGVSNFMPLKDQLFLIQDMVPSLKKLGLIYNPGEANSVSLVKKIKHLAKEIGITIVEATALKTSDIAQATRSLQPKVQAILVTNDNTALSAFATITKITTETKTPLFVSDTDMVNQGALAALGPDQYQIGRQTGKMVRRLLEGERIQNIPVEYPEKINLALNPDIAKKIGYVSQKKGEFAPPT